MYPFLLRPMLLDKVWGGDRLAAFGKPVAKGAHVGESWELADLAATSAGGAGGTPMVSVVRNGPFAGRTLRQVIASQGRAVTGSIRMAADGGYPLLVKYLDAAEHLSIQVHPSPAYAASHPGALIKSECWLVLAARPGAIIYAGLKPGTTRASFLEATKTGRTPECMNAIEVTAGECYALPSGTCHALGAGVACLEVQTASDTTFRVHDWGRTGRELHLDQAMACIDFDAPPVTAVRPDQCPAGRPFLSTPDFTLEYREIGPEGLPLADRPGPVAIIGGKGSLVDWLKGYRPERVAGGTTLLVPHQVPIAARLVGEVASPLRCVLVTAAAAT